MFPSIHRVLPRLTRLGVALIAAGSLRAVDLHVQNFDAGPGSLFVTGVNPTWAHGTPTSGPLAAQSGVQCWATGLAGNHANNEDSYLTSGAVDLSAHAGGPFIFSWWQFLETEAGYDAGSLEVSRDGGVSWERVYGEASGPVAMAWTRQFVLLDSSAAVSNFRYRFRMHSDGSGAMPGYYIDTIRIFALTHQQVYSEDFEAGPAGYAPEGTNSTWEHGTPVEGPGGAWSGSMAWGTELDAYYAPSEDSALVSAPIDLSAHAGKAFVVSWRQHLTTEPEFDLAKVEVRSSTSSAWTGGYGPVSGVVSDVWMRQSILVGPEMATSGFQLRFALAADPFFENSGFYIDDVEIHTIEGGASPPVTWPSPDPIASGTALDGTQLNAASTVPGTFFYTPAAGTTLPPGNGQTLTAIFTPDDLLTYSPVVSTVSIDVSGGISYEVWVSFPPGTPVADTLPGADFDQDGSTNFCEYGFVTGVTGGDDSLAPRLILVEDGGILYPGIEFSVRANDPALQYAFEISPDLAAWNAFGLGFDGAWSVASGGPVLHSAVEGGPESGVWRLQVRSDVPITAGGRLFMRVSVTR